MGFKIQYKKLFEVQILHDYYRNNGTTLFEELDEAEKAQILKEYNILQDLAIVPTRECLMQLKNYGLVYKQSSDGFFVGVQVKESPGTGGTSRYQPFIPFKSAFKLSFALQLRNALFSNFTSLPLTSAGKKIYYFSNLAGQAKSVFPTLSLPLTTFKSGTTYAAGDLIFQGNRLFEALTETDKKPTLSGTDWQVIRQRPYTFSQDQIAVLSGIYNYTFAEQNTSTQVHFTVVDPALMEGTKPEIFHESVTSQVPLRQYQLDFRGLASGKYQLTVKGNNGYSDKVHFYLWQGAPGGTPFPFGLIEIFNLPSEPLAGYALLDPMDGETLLSPVYQIFFKNRSTFWRYIFSKDQTVENGDLGQLEREALNEKRRFITKQVLPLTCGFEEVKKFNTDISLPNPSANLIKPENKRLYSEIYINS